MGIDSELVMPTPPADLKTPVQSFTTRQMLRLSASRQIDGLWVGCYYKEDAEASLRPVEDALRLIKAHDPRRYRRLLRDLERIWVLPIVGSIAHFEASIWACVLDPRFILDGTKTAEEIAGVIVHEATHARLWRCGYRYSEEVRSRVEAICFRCERAFAARLPNGEQIQEDADRKLKDYANQEFWTDQAFRQRYEEELPKVLEYSGMPKWMVPGFQATRWVLLRLVRWRKGSRRK